MTVNTVKLQRVRVQVPPRTHRDTRLKCEYVYWLACGQRLCSTSLQVRAMEVQIGLGSQNGNGLQRSVQAPSRPIGSTYSVGRTGRFPSGQWATC